MGLEVLEHLPLDEHEARTAVTHLDAAASVCLCVPGAYHVEHERTCVVLQVFFACLSRALDAIPVHFLLGVDAACYVLVC